MAILRLPSRIFVWVSNYVFMSSPGLLPFVKDELTANARRFFTEFRRWVSSDIFWSLAIFYNR